MEEAPHHTSLCIAAAIGALLGAGVGCYNPWAATPCAGAAACAGTLLSPRKPLHRAPQTPSALAPGQQALKDLQV